MNPIETIIPIESRASIDIGRSGENAARKISFDMTSWYAEYGRGITLAVIFERSDGNIYPLIHSADGDICSIVISRNETAMAGPGRLEVRAYHGDVLRKSVRFITLCATSLQEPGDVPELPIQGWIDRIMALVSTSSPITLGRSLLWDEKGQLAVDVADTEGTDKTRPVSESFMESVVGNIEVLLKTL